MPLVDHGDGPPSRDWTSARYPSADEVEARAAALLGLDEARLLLVSWVPCARPGRVTVSIIVDEVLS